MSQLTRREFLDRLGKLGLMLAGSLVVPYIPKVIYSIPIPTQAIVIKSRQMGMTEMQMWFDHVEFAGYQLFGRSYATVSL